MPKNLIPSAIFLLAFAGLIDAWYLMESAYTGTALSCSIAYLDGCNAVATSPYSWLFGQPLALYGVVFYGIVLFVSLIILFSHRPLFTRTLVALSSIGFIASIAFIALQVFVIKALCIYCIGSALVAFALFVVCLRYLRSAQTPAPLVSGQI